MEHNEDDSGVDSEDEGLELLLRGLSLSAVSAAAWHDDDDDKQSDDTGETERRNVVCKTQTNHSRKAVLVGVENLLEVETLGCYDRAFHCSPTGQLVRPPIRIVDMSSVNNRGNGLVATCRIPKDQVIFTERAAEATQLPCTCVKCRDEPSTRWESSCSVRACQHCFRSLEPISSVSSNLPKPNLWPITEYRQGNQEEGGKYRTDSIGRVQCKSCRSLFCSSSCKDAHEQRMGNCCDSTCAVNAVVHALHPSRVDESDGDSDAESFDLQPAVILATRMFVALSHRYRTSGECGLGPFDGLCGSANDVTPLELGLEQILHDGTPSYNLNTAYKTICDVLATTDEEMKHFSLEMFERLAAIAARNGFAVKTQSPFRTYHASLLRTSGGRQTDRHAALLKQVAIALGSSDGTLNRDMDRQVEERCTVEAVALFTLTARINHSCDPNAEVRNQEFVDCHVDLVAKRDINAGEEITISYINVGRTAGRSARDTNRRRRELQSKYLFTCDCNLCQGYLAS